MAIADLFDATSVPATVRAPDSGLLVTNHLNMMYMLAAGLVMPPAGFGDKYYRDTPRRLSGLDSPVHRQGARRGNRVVHDRGGTSQAEHRRSQSRRVVGPSDGDRRRWTEGDCFPGPARRDRTRAPRARAAAHVPDRVDCVSVGGRQTGMRSGFERIRQRAAGILQAQDEQSAVHQGFERSLAVR